MDVFTYDNWLSFYKLPLSCSPLPTKTFLYAQSLMSKPAIAVIGGNLKAGSLGP